MLQAAEYMFRLSNIEIQFMLIQNRILIMSDFMDLKMDIFFTEMEITCIVKPVDEGVFLEVRSSTSVQE